VGVKFLHAADLHLGCSFKSSRFPAGTARKRRAELMKSLGRVVALAAEHRVNFIMLSGDVFEYRYLTRTGLNTILADLERAEVPVFIAPGNHDPALEDSFYRTVTWPENVRLFVEEHWQQERLDLDIPVTIHGLGWNRWEIKQNLLSSLRVGVDANEGQDGRDGQNDQNGQSDQNDQNDQKEAHIVMVHGDTLNLGGGTPYLPLPEEDMESCGAHYLALGHFHGHSARRLTNGALAVYSGSPEPLDFGDEGEHGVVIGFIEGGRATVDLDYQFIPIATRSFLRVDLKVPAVIEQTDLAERVRAAAANSGSPDDIFTLRLTGLRDPETPIDVAALRAEVSEGFFHIEIEDKTLPSYDLDSLKEQGNKAVRLFIEAMEGRIARAPEGSGEREAAEWALYLGLDALTRQKVEVGL